MLARNGVSECELLKLIPMKWSDWLNLSDALHHSGIIVTRMGLMSLANKQVSFYLMYAQSEIATMYAHVFVILVKFFAVFRS